MPKFSRVTLAIKAVRQLGPTQVALNALYRLGLKTGHYKRIEARGVETNTLLSMALFSLPSREQLLESIGPGGRQALLAEADEIVAGKVRLFGVEPVDL